MTPFTLEKDNIFTKLQGRGEEVPGVMRPQGLNTMQWAHPRGSFQTTPLLGHPRPLAIPMTIMAPTASTLTTPIKQIIFEWVSTPLDKFAEKKITQLPRFAEIAQSLRESPTPQATTNLPQEIILIPNLLVGAATTPRLSA